MDKRHSSPSVSGLSLVISSCPSCLSGLFVDPLRRLVEPRLLVALGKSPLKRPVPSAILEVTRPPFLPYPSSDGVD